MSSFATPANPGHPADPPKRKASTAAIDESEEYSKRRIPPDSRRRRAKAQTISAPNIRLQAGPNGPFDTRKRPILQPTANASTGTEKRAALQKDLTTVPNTDSEIALGYESDIKESRESTINKAKPSFSETYHKDNIFLGPVGLTEKYDGYIAEEKRLQERLAALEHDIMVTRERNVRLERELTEKLKKLCADDVE